MPIGGGTFTQQNKVLPGAYINFVSMAVSRSGLSERGIAALPLDLDWGPGGVFTVTAQEFARNCRAIFGYPHGHEKLRRQREIFRRAHRVHFYKLGTGGSRAANAFGTAKHVGERGNALINTIEPAGTSFVVSTYLEKSLVDEQTVASAAELADNSFMDFDKSATLALTSGTPLTGGTNGTVASGDHQTALDNLESFHFNTLGCLSADETVKGLYAAYTKRMREETGAKFQCVLHRYAAADHEGVISVENNDTPELVAWVTGASAGCEINRSLQNTIYSGEYEVDVDHTKVQLEDAIESGKFIFCRVGDERRVLEDINTLVTHTDAKNGDFSSNQTIRVLDQVAVDIAELFNNKYLGEIPNDTAGRTSLWSDIVSHHKEMQQKWAIENFEPSNVKIERGEHRRSVVVDLVITPVNAMSHLYMTVVVQ